MGAPKADTSSRLFTSVGLHLAYQKLTPGWPASGVPVAAFWLSVSLAVRMLAAVEHFWQRDWLVAVEPLLRQSGLHG